MLKHQYSTVWGVRLDVGMHSRSWNCYARLRHWCMSHIMRQRPISTLLRGSRRAGVGAQLQPLTPACALEYVTSQHGPGWAIARHSAMPY